LNDSISPIKLADCYLRAELLPAYGGAIASLMLKTPEGEWVPVLNTDPHPSRTGVFALGCNVLAPFSNRISGGGFWQDGAFHALAPNIDGEPYPNHGNAFSSEWVVVQTTETEAVFSLVSDGPGPFRYEAQLTYRLAEGELVAELVLTNRGDVALPFGGGFHPWFKRTDETRVQFRADGVWSETSDHLPDQYLLLDLLPERDHRAGQHLSDAFTNVAYAGWDGIAELTWPELGMGLTMTANSPLSVLMLYTPDNQSGFFSLEPVSHTVDAHNRMGEGVVRPAILGSGESLTMTMRLKPHML
jgi:aldose 1-epimerase